jgi:hypothetical protein
VKHLISRATEVTPLKATAKGATEGAINRRKRRRQRLTGTEWQDEEWCLE